MITHKELKALVRYEPETGHFYWLVGGHGRKRQKILGRIRSKGYRTISINGKDYQAGRLAFFYMTGHWPTPTVDHRNRIRDDDRWENLREATHREQKANSKPLTKPRKNNALGHLNISRDRVGFSVFIKGLYIGWAKTLKEAIELRDNYKNLI